MSKAPDMVAADGAHAHGIKAIKFSRDWITRPVFGVALALAVMAAIYGGTTYLALVVAVVVFAAAREWHRMVKHGKIGIELAITTATIWLALAAYVFWPKSFAPAIILVCGALLTYALTAARKSDPVWHAGGVLYLGVPALAILMVRDLPRDGAWLVVGLFIAVWATDTGALIAGNLLGGPKLAPVLSPNKTWAGFFGGVIAAAILEAIFVALIGGNLFVAAMFGAVLAVFAHLGDLFESWVKRHFHTKDSGGLIPGHGGALDRIDSTLAAVLALAIAVFVFHLDPLFGAHP